MSIIAKVKGALGLNSAVHPNVLYRQKMRTPGDFGLRPRLVLHTARFASDSQAQAFKTFVTFRGYDVVEASQSNVVCFQRVSKIVGKHFDAETDALRMEIEDLRGDYLGFGNASLR